MRARSAGVEVVVAGGGGGSVSWAEASSNAVVSRPIRPSRIVLAFNRRPPYNIGSDKARPAPDLCSGWDSVLMDIEDADQHKELIKSQNKITLLSQFPYVEP